MTPRTQPTVERAPEIGDAIAHYRIIGVVGDGSSGRLCVAEQNALSSVSKRVALRCIRPELAGDPQLRASFIDAASIAPRFEHPNVVSIYEMRELAGRYFFSMEYVCGENVASILTRFDTSTHAPVEISASIVKHAANALQYLHDFRAAEGKPVGLAPGEVNPSHLFVTYHGTIKLLDTGLKRSGLAQATATSGEYRVSSSSARRAYLAPEAHEGVADRRSDVFSLGALLWTCLTGRNPELADEGVPPSRARADVPEELDAVVMRALSRDPEQRFQSARELSEALDRHLLRHSSRPTHKHVRRWMEQLFDRQRAALQMQIIQGRNVEKALELLGYRPRSAGLDADAEALPGMKPRELWSTSDSVFSGLTRSSLGLPRSVEQRQSSIPQERLPVSAIVLRPSRTPPGVPMPPLELPNLLVPAAAAKPRRWVTGALLAAGVVAVLGTAAILASSGESSPFSEASRGPQALQQSGQIEVKSTPDGAAVFVDGEPTGLRTPAVLKGLTAGGSLRVRVDKAGFVSQERVIAITGGSLESHSFELFSSDGAVHFSGVPSDARLYVDDVVIALEPGKPVSLTVGRHNLRVETPGALVFSGTVDVVAGEQTISVDDARAAP